MHPVLVFIKLILTAGENISLTYFKKISNMLTCLIGIGKYCLATVTVNAVWVTFRVGVKMLFIGKKHIGELPPLTSDETAAAIRLKADVMVLAGAIGERNTDKYEQLCTTADFIADRFSDLGFAVRRDEYDVAGVSVANIEAELAGSKRGHGVIIVGAHYDSPPNSAGADDNASGVAALLELARRFQSLAKPRHTIRFAAFVNEEPPYFHTDLMGSRVYAKRAKERGDRIKAMLCMDCIGFFSDANGSL